MILALIAAGKCGAAEPLLGVYGDNSMRHVLDFERWLGRQVDVILCTIDFNKWENYRYADWLSQTVYGARGERRLVYDVPIIIQGASYAEAKSGAYDDHWRCLAQSILANNTGTYEIVIRPSHEMNGDWFAWGVGGSRAASIPDFIASWRRFHGVFRGVPGGERYRFSFSASEGASDPRPMWPGDDYVDLVGCDVYWKPKIMGGQGWEANDPRECWEMRVSRTGYNGWNLIGMLDFARAKGKPFQIDEWGVSGDNAAPFVEGMATFLRDHGLRSHTYWNSNSAYPGQLSTRDLEWPSTTAAFKTNFEKPGRVASPGRAPATAWGSSAPAAVSGLPVSVAIQGCEGPYTVERWRQDWPGCEFEGGVKEGHLQVTERDGVKWLRVNYAPGQIGPELCGAGWRWPFGSHNGAELRYTVRFGQDFDFVKGGKLPGLCGGPENVSGGRAADGRNGFSARLMWRRDGRGEAYVYHMNQPEKYGESFPFPDDFRFPPGKPVHVRIAVVMNAGGLRDGILRVWTTLPGQGERLMLERLDMEWRSAETFNVDSLYFETFHGGNDASWAPTRPCYAEFAGFHLLKTTGR
ncbi:MAG: hypothetical protein IT577_12360 [Verrucomicrobiae bacterium]|nr:hypothetical protein [Verrucomicrobiae bacterium]